MLRRVTLLRGVTLLRRVALLVALVILVVLIVGAGHGRYFVGLDESDEVLLEDDQCENNYGIANQS